MSHKPLLGEDMEDITSDNSTNTEDQNTQKDVSESIPTAKVRLNSSIENELQQHMTNLQLVRQTESANGINTEHDANMHESDTTRELHEEADRLKLKRSSTLLSTEEQVGSTVDKKRIKLANDTNHYEEEILDTNHYEKKDTWNINVIIPSEITENAQVILHFTYTVPIAAHSNTRRGKQKLVQQAITVQYLLEQHPLNQIHWHATFLLPTLDCTSTKFMVEIHSDKGTITEPRPHTVQKQTTTHPNKYFLYQRMTPDTHDTFKFLKKLFKADAQNAVILLENLLHDAHKLIDTPERRLAYFETRFEHLWRCLTNVHDAVTFDVKPKLYQRVYVPNDMLEQITIFVDSQRTQTSTIEGVGMLVSILTFLLEHTSHLSKNADLVYNLDTIVLDWISKHSLFSNNVSRAVSHIVKEHWRASKNISFAWAMLAPYLARDCNQQSRTTSYWSSNLSDGLYNTLMRDSKVTVKSYKQSMEGWIENIPIGLQQPISRYDLTILASVCIMFAPTFECVFLASKFFQLINGKELFEEQFAEYLKKYNFDNNTEQKFTALTNQIKAFPDDFTDVVVCGLFSNTSVQKLLYGYLDVLQLFLQRHEPSERFAGVLIDWLDANFCAQKIQKSLPETIDFWSLIINLIKDSTLEKYETAIKEKFMLAYVVRDEVGLAGLLKLDESYFVAEMGDILIKRARSITESLIRNGQTRSLEDAVDALVYRSQNNNEASPLGVAVIQTLLESIATNNVTLKELFNDYLTWCKILRNTPLEHSCKQANDLITLTFSSLNDKTITLTDLRLLTDNFIVLCEAINIYLLDTLAKSKKEQKQFEEDLSDVQFFVINYCEGVDSSSLKNILKYVEQNESVIPFSRLQQVFKEVEMKHFITDLSLLRYLGSGEIFMRIWRDEISQLTIGMFVLHANLLEQANLMTINVSEDDEEEEARSFTLQAVVDTVLPRVKQSWLKLCNDINNSSITFTILEKYFHGLNEDRVRTELILLKSTCCNPNSRDPYSDNTVVQLGKAPPADWLQENVTVIANFIFILNQKKLIPEVRHAVTLFSRVFMFKLDNDIYYQKLVEMERIFIHKWDGEATLFTVSEFINPVRGLLDRFGADETKLIHILRDANDLLDWLFEHRDTNAFNELIRVCRSLTDDALLLQSFASLAETRNYLYPLLYPEQSFSSVDTFLHVLTRRNKEYSAELLEERRKDVSFVKAKLEAVKQVFRDKTRSPGVAACFQVMDVLKKGEYIIDTSKTSNNMIVCRVESQTLTMEDLLDVRTTLLNTEIPVELREKHGSLEEVIALFSKQITVLLSVRKSLNSLSNHGNGNYVRRYRTSFNARPENFGQLEAEQRRLKDERNNWKITIEDVRNKYYFLNHYNMIEIMFFIDLLDEVSLGITHRENKFDDLLLIISKEVNKGTIDRLVLSWKEFKLIQGESTVEQKLDYLGQLLNNIFAHSKPFYREIGYEVRDDRSTQFDEHQQIIVLDSPEKEIPHVVFSIFARKGRLPEHEEVLMCSEATELEDVVLLLNRWKQANLYNRNNNIYVLANLHLLSYTLQCRVVDVLKSMIPATDGSILIMIGANPERQRIVNAFSTFCFEGSVILPLDELKRAYQSVCDPNVYSGGIHAFSSTIAGGGKTTRILKHAVSMDNQAVYARIPLREAITTRDLIRRLKGIKQDYPVCYHFDVAPNVSTEANAMLFELFIVGVLRDRRAVRTTDDIGVFHRRLYDSFMLEVPNSPGNRTQTNLLSLTLAIPNTVLTVDMSNLELHTYKVNSTGRISKDFDDKLQFVCKYLKAYADGVFQNGGDFVDSNKHLNAAECFAIINRYSHMAENQLSWTLFRNFISFTYEQLWSIHQYQLLADLIQLSQTVQELQDIRILRHTLVALVLETTKDFATRNIELNLKQEANLEEYANRFKQIRTWEQSKHPIPVFSYDQDNFGMKRTTGFNLVSTDPQFLDRFIHTGLQSLLIENMMDIKFSFRQCVENEGQIKAETKALSLLKSVAGRIIESDEQMREYNDMVTREFLLNTDYVMTEDNLLKMFAIIMRFNHNLPVVICGETGCGKSYLIEYLCKILDYSTRRLAIHGGYTDDEVENFIREVRIEAEQSSQCTFVAFLDEINTCNSMGILKEIICDRFLDGSPLPDNMKIIAALNPYRLRSNEATESHMKVGLVYKHARDAISIPDPLENLVYRVHPVGDSFCDHMYDFGRLSDECEKIYVTSMIVKSLLKASKTSITGPIAQTISAWSKDAQVMLELFITLLCQSQKFVREATKEISSVSLRDIERCIRLFLFFDTLNDNILPTRGGEVFKQSFDYRIRQNFNKCLIEALGHVYYSRLSRKSRQKYIEHVERSAANFSLYTFNARHFAKQLNDTQLKFTKLMDPPRGIALNEALCENLFMIFVSILNKIPIFIVGPPGTSKSLAIDLIAKSMRGQGSNNPWLRSKPSVDVFSYQCSPLSTAGGIEQVFTTARQYAAESKSLVVCLLDEIGLAEQSKHLPLKVLHKELEQREVAVVAVSNFHLDSAKMNRAVTLLRSPPTKRDLQITAEGIVDRVHLSNYLKSIAEAYKDVYSNQTIPDFWGLREFYYIVKYINNQLLGGDQCLITPQLMLEGVLRNFGGRPSSETEKIIQTFAHYTKMYAMSDNTNVRRPSNLELIRSNLVDLNARHLMLLTQNNVALNMLFDFDLLNMGKTDVIVGSDFPDDNTNFSISLDLQRIKIAMACGHRVVLVHCDSLYESLYDLLNQHYVEFEGKRYARLAFGQSFVTCPVDKNFRIIVIAEAEDAYKRLAAPLLNRLEKQVFVREHLSLSRTKRELLGRLTSFVRKVCGTGDTGSLFIGLRESALISLIHCIDTDQDEIMTEEDVSVLERTAVDKLLAIAAPEAVLSFNDMDITNRYFNQHNSSLVEFLGHELQANSSALKLFVTTYSPLDIELERSVFNYLQTQSIGLHYVQLHEMRTSTDLNRAIDEFMKSDENESMLVLVCDPIATSFRRIQYAQYECEKMRDITKKRHVVILVNLMRGHKFTFDFDRRWHHVFIDDVRDGISIRHLISRPLSEILSSQNVGNLIMSNLHHSLSRLVYPYSRTSSDIRDQLHNIRSLLMDSKFRSITEDKVIKLVNETKLLTKSDQHWFLSVIEDYKELCLSGTFRSALEHFISKTCYIAFAAILAFVDRYNNLNLVATDKLWLDFYESVHVGTFEPYIVQLIQMSQVDVRFEKIFSASFPFSYSICGFVRSALDEMHGQRTIQDESMLVKQLDMTYPMLNNPHESVTLLLHDYVRYFTQYSDDMFNIILEIVLKTHWEVGGVGVELDSVPRILVLYFINERRIQLWSNIIQTMNESNPEFITTLKSSVQSLTTSSQNLLIELDSMLCNQVIKELDPQTWGIKNIGDAQKWMTIINCVREPMNQLLSLEWSEYTINATQKDDEEAEPVSPLSPVATIFAPNAAHATWDRMLFFTQFIRDLAVREQLDISQCLLFYHNLSHEGLLALTGLLTSVNQEYARNGDDFECIMCLEIPEKMRETRCCHQVICEDCVEEFIANQDSHKNGCMYCRSKTSMDSVDAYSVQTGKETDVEDARLKEQSFIKHASQLIEVFINEYLLRSPTSEDIGTVLQYITSDPALPKNKLSFIVSDSMISSVIRKLLTSSNEVSEIENQCKRLFKIHKTIDFPLAVAITQVREDQLQTLSLQSLVNQHRRYLSPSSSIVSDLTTIAYKKVLTRHLVHLLTSNADLDNHFVDVLDIIFHSTEAIMYLLRKLTHRKGISYTKSALREQLSHIKSIAAWCETREAKMFVSVEENPFRSSNPFLAAYSSDECFRALDIAVQELVMGLMDKMDKALKERDKKKLQGYLLMCLFENAALLDRDVTEYFKSQKSVSDIYPVIQQLPTIATLGAPLGRVVIHTVAVTIIQGENMGVFYNLWANPRNLVQTYLPTMHEDVRQSLRDVFGGTGVFYECPNGHAYFVDNCGKPMEIRTCATCGVQIGGEHHNLLNSNRTSDLTDMTPKNYVLHEIIDKRADMFFTVRSLTPKALRALRLFMHALLYVGSITSSTHASSCKSLLDSKFTNPSNITAFFQSQLESDWEMLLGLIERNVEETSIIMNDIVFKLAQIRRLEPTLVSKEKRNQFETEFSHAAIGGLQSENFEPQHITNVRTRFYAATQELLQKYTSPLVAKILETDETHDPKEMPSLWMITEDITFDHFILRCLQNNEFPFLQRFATRHVQLRALKYLPDIVQLLNFVLSKYNRRVARDYCKTTTVEQEIAEMSRRERIAFEKYFNAFCEAWNCCWSAVEQYKCMPIPKIMKNVTMDASKSLIFIIPNEKDESVFILALLQYLVDLHNEFVEATQQITTSRAEEISSRFIASGQEIITNEEDLMLFLKDHCGRPLRYGKRDVEYDLQFIQQFLLDNSFIGRPRLTLEVRTVEFLGEIRETGARQRFTALIHQEDLRHETKHAVRSLTMENCRKLLRLVEMSINFLQATTAQKQHVAERSLVEYLEQDLDVADTHLFASTIRDIKLKHLDSLWKTLESHLTSDIFSDVHPNYRLPLGDVKILLDNVVERMDCKLLAERLREYLLRHLIGSSTSPNAPLKSCLEYFPVSDESEDVTFSDLTWFEAYFPMTIRVSQTLDTYKLLSNAADNNQKL